MATEFLLWLTPANSVTCIGDMFQPSFDMLHECKLLKDCLTAGHV